MFYYFEHLEFSAVQSSKMRKLVTFQLLNDVAMSAKSGTNRRSTL